MSLSRNKRTIQEAHDRLGRTERHRPLMAGLRIRASSGSGGTLTGIARDNQTNERVLVTNLHVLTGAGKVDMVTGNEELFQGVGDSTAPADKIGTIERP